MIISSTWSTLVLSTFAPSRTNILLLNSTCLIWIGGVSLTLTLVLILMALQIRNLILNKVFYATIISGFEYYVTGTVIVLLRLARGFYTRHDLTTKVPVIKLRIYDSSFRGLSNDVTDLLI